MGWGKILGTIGGLASFAIPGVGPVLGSTILSAASGIGGAVDAMQAEKKAANQQVAGATQANARLSPYNTLGLQSANSLAGLLGLPGLGPNAGGGLPPGSPMPAPLTRAVTPAAMDQTQPMVPPLKGGATLASMRMGPTSSRGPAPSSYGGRF